MTRFRCFLAAAVLCFSLPASGLAMPSGAQPPGITGAAVTADELAAMGLGQTDTFATHPVYRHDQRLDQRLNLIATQEQPEAADAFETRVDRAVKAAIERAIVPALKAQAAADAAAEAARSPQVVYLQAPSEPATGPSVLGLAWADFLKLAGMILTGIAAVLFPLIFKANAEAKKAEYGRWAVWAYHAVQEFAALTPNKIDDLAAQGLAVVAGVLAPGAELNKKELAAAALYSQRLGEKGLALTGSVLADAKATWQGISGEEKTEAAVRAKAVALAEQASAKTITELAATGTAAEPAARPQTPPAA